MEKELVTEDLYLTNLLICSMEQSSSREANWFAASQAIPHIL